MKRKLSLITVIVLAWGLAALLAILPVRAEAPRAGTKHSAHRPTAPESFVITFTVNYTADVGDTNWSDNYCDAFPDAAVQCSLRAAIQTANNFDAGMTDFYTVTIIVPAGRYTLTIPFNGADDQSGDLDVTLTHTLIILGAGPADTIIRGSL